MVAVGSHNVLLYTDVKPPNVQGVLANLVGELLIPISSALWEALITGRLMLSKPLGAFNLDLDFDLDVVLGCMGGDV